MGAMYSEGKGGGGARARALDAEVVGGRARLSRVLAAVAYNPTVPVLATVPSEANVVVLQCL